MSLLKQSKRVLVVGSATDGRSTMVGGNDDAREDPRSAFWTSAEMAAPLRESWLARRSISCCNARVQFARLKEMMAAVDRLDNSGAPRRSCKTEALRSASRSAEPLSVVDLGPAAFFGRGGRA